jgi:hypothetical protein
MVFIYTYSNLPIDIMVFIYMYSDELDVETGIIDKYI